MRMSKIQFTQISDNVVEITIPAETPLVIVGQLTKSLQARGLVEDLQKSTLSTRYFYKPQDTANNLADKLIKSLENMTGLSKTKLPWWAGSQSEVDAHRAKRDMYNAEDRAKRANIKPTITPTVPKSPSPGGPNTLPGVPNKLYNPDLSGTVDYSRIKKGEHDDENLECSCEKCEMTKSGTGPKGWGLYSPNDNARRKMKNVGDKTGIGPNVNTKAYSSKPGQMSAKQSANLTARIQAKASKNNPVTKLTPEQIAAQYPSEYKFKKSWIDHLPFPNAEEEMMRLASANQLQAGDDAMAHQLANMMNSKAMLNPNYRQPTSEDMLMAGESMGLGVSEEVAKSADKQWNGVINNWLIEAVKPISSRFSSEEEEVAYWDSIKVNGGREEDPGY